MATLTSEFQYVGRSRGLSSMDGKLSYYVLLYAKTIADISTGIHTVTIREVLASTNSGATFYQWNTTFSGEINNITAFSGTNKPWAAWELPDFTADGVTYKEGTVIAEGSINVDCSNGLSKDIPISCTWTFTSENVASYTPVPNSPRTASATVTLSAIPRFATLVSAPNFSDGDNPTITYSNPAGTAVDSLVVGIYATDNQTPYVSYKEANETGTSYTFELTDAERERLLGAVTQGDSVAVKFFLRTTIGGSIFYSSLERTFYITDPNPVVEGLIQCDDKTYALTGDRTTLIKFFSSVTATMTATAQKGATIDESSYTIRNGENDGDGKTCTFDNVENPAFTFFAKDSRGNVGKDTKTATMVDYIKLTCTIGNDRPDALGNMSVSCVGDYFEGSFGSKGNTITAQYRYKVEGGTFSEDDWQDMAVIPMGKNRYYASADFVIENFNQDAFYSFQTRAKDEVMTVPSTEFSAKSKPIFHWGENDFVFEVPVSFNGGIVGLPALDYGYWQPTLSSSAISSYTNQNGWYMKMGQNVTVGFFVKATCRTGYESTMVSISGLPFTPMASAAGGGMCSGAYVSAGFNFQCFATGANGIITTRVQACNNTSATNLSTSASGCFYPSGGGQITLSGTITYIANS